MAEPVGFEGANTLFSGESAGCNDLETFTDGQQIISCWRFTEEEIETIRKNGVIWLSVWGQSLHPVLISADALVMIDGRPSKPEPVIPKRRIE